MILVENHPQKPKIGWMIITPWVGGEVLISVQIYVLTICVHIGVVNSGRHDSPHIPVPQTMYWIQTESSKWSLNCLLRDPRDPFKVFQL